MTKLSQQGKENTPTVACTKKPESQKKARRTSMEMDAKDKEIAKEETEIETALDSLTLKAKNYVTALARSCQVVSGAKSG